MVQDNNIHNSGDSGVGSAGRAPTSADAAVNLRDQYYQCLASGQDNCPLPPRAASSGQTDQRSLELTDPYAGITRPQAITDQTVLPRANWTVAVNLTTTLSHSVDPGRDQTTVYAGARNQAAHLLALADSTRGKPVTLVVQNAEPDPSRDATGGKGVTLPGNGAPAVKNYTLDEKSEKGDTGNGQLVHTYLIHDGQIDELPTRPSAGVAADTRTLLTVAGRQAPSEHLALISQSHGGGPDGIESDTGQASLSQLNGAIEAGLAASGRSKLDLLDLDACSMGNARVLTALAGSADQIVASPYVESSAGPHVDAQNTGAILSSLLSNPQMSSEQLGRQIINLANQGANGGEAAPDPRDREAGTRTLSLYDASKVDAFAGRVDQLGTALSQAWDQPLNRPAIRRAIQNAPLADALERVGTVESPTPEQRDARSFASNIVQAVDGGQIADRHGALKQAAEAMLTAQSQMVESYHGEHTGGFNRQGGVSMFLPGNDFFDSAARALDVNPLELLAHLNQSKERQISSKDSALYDVDHAIAQSKAVLGSGSDSAFATLQQARDLMARSNNQAQYHAALNHISQLARSLDQTATGQLLMQHTMVDLGDHLDDTLLHQLDPATPHWNEFLKSVATTAQANNTGETTKD